MRFVSVACVLFLSALLFAAGIPPAAAEPSEGPTAAEHGVILNLSGRQRMLTQRMTKEMLLVALEVDQVENVMRLEETATLFAATLHGLRNGSKRLGLPGTTAKPILAQLDKIDARWKRFDTIVQAVLECGQVDRKQAALIADENLPLLEECDKAVQLYEEAAKVSGLKSDPTLAHAINLSGRQRMLSQKMSKEYCLVALGLDVETSRKNLSATAALFQKTLLGLVNGDKSLGLSPAKEPAIKTQLERVKKQWRLFRPYLDNAAKEGWEITDVDLLDVADMNTKLLAEMNQAVKLYETATVKKSD